MSTKVMELNALFSQDDFSKYITMEWTRLQYQRQPKLAQWQELRDYVFAIDTTTTTNASLPWKNSTTLPKLCQIRDNLHSNYLQALFPNDDWLRWEGYSKDDVTADKSEAIEAYMKNKTREGGFRTLISRLLYDYIDYGNVFAFPTFINSGKFLDGEYIPDFIGPKANRISPLDIVFNPLAEDFKSTFKIVRSVKTVGEIEKMIEDEPQNADLKKALEQRNLRLSKLGGYSIDDINKWNAYSVDGFGNLYEYYKSGYIELLEFYGTWHNQITMKMEVDRVITVMDRAHVVRNIAQPSWFGHAPLFHVGWRFRPDNLWAMGPLDNLVGMQYRIDHLENAKADAIDLAIQPPLKIIGEVEEFIWGPSAEIHIDGEGDVVEMGRNAQWVITAQNDIQQLEMRMEQFAGAPSEAMGIRTAGEKTAFEVSQLQNAAGRIFQEKVSTFEQEVLEPLLNSMFEMSKRFMDTSDVVRVMDDDLGVQRLLSVTKADITATGKLRAIGARHFASQAQLMQNLTQLGNSQIGQMIMPHVSGKAMAKLVEDILGLERFNLMKPNVAIEEQMETQQLANEAQQQTQVAAGVGMGAMDGEGEATDIPPQAM